MIIELVTASLLSIMPPTDAPLAPEVLTACDAQISRGNAGVSDCVWTAETIAAPAGLVWRIGSPHVITSLLATYSVEACGGGSFSWRLVVTNPVRNTTRTLCSETIQGDTFTRAEDLVARDPSCFAYVASPTESVVLDFEFTGTPCHGIGYTPGIVVYR